MLCVCMLYTAQQFAVVGRRYGKIADQLRPMDVADCMGADLISSATAVTALTKYVVILLSAIALLAYYLQ
jgi:hypothetical protein